VDVVGGDLHATSTISTPEPAEQRQDFFVCGLPEVSVPLSHSSEAERSMQNDDLVGFLSKRSGGVSRRDRHRQDEAVCSPLAQYPQGGPGGESGSEAIIDDNHRPTGYRQGWEPFSVRLYPAGEFPLLVGLDAGDLVLCHTQHVDQFEIERSDPVFADRPNAQFGTSRCSDLPDDDDVQGGPEQSGCFRRNDNSTPWQPDHHRVDNRQVQQTLTQTTSRVDPVGEGHTNSLPYRILRRQGLITH
jgi:hypothetical protein